MDFETLEQDIEQLNRINPNANDASFFRYRDLFKSILERLLEMESRGEIETEPGKKGIGYCRTLLQNDGPEYSYSVAFWKKVKTPFWKKKEMPRKYKIGVCIRGTSKCKPLEEW